MCLRLFARSTCALLILTASLSGQDLLYLENGTADGEYLGYAVAGLPDLNGDGVGEMAFGAPQADGTQPGVGAVRVLAGRSGAVLYSYAGSSTGDWFGASVAHVGDVDGDGTADFAIGASGDDAGVLNGGAARVYSGSTGVPLHEFIGTIAGEGVGTLVRGVGDVNGDGFDDIAVANQYWANPNFGTGWLRIHSGADGAVLHSFVGAEGWALVGRTVAGIGDVDGDGKGDFVMGFHRPLPVKVHAFSGATGAILWSVGPNYPIEAMAPAGDLDGDGVDDVIFGGVNKTFLHSGLDGTLLREHDHDIDFGSGFMYQNLAGGGDVNGDGWDDYAIGAYWHHYENQTDGNFVKVISGFNGNVIGTITGDSDASHMGASVALAELDGDGLVDLIAGAPWTTIKQKGQVVAYGFPFETRSFCPGEPNSTGAGAKLRSQGTVSITLNDFTLTVRQLPPNQWLYFVTSLTVGEVHAPGGSDGTLCLGGGIGRFTAPGQVLNSGATGTAALQLDLTQHASAGGWIAVQPGETWHYQGWYRDVGSTSNFSNALAANFKL